MTPTTFHRLIENPDYDALQQARRVLTSISIRLNHAVEIPDASRLDQIRQDLMPVASQLAINNHPAAGQAEALVDQARMQLFAIKPHDEAPRLSGVASNAEKLIDQARRIIFDANPVVAENLDDDLHKLIQIARGVQDRNDPAEIQSFLSHNRATSIQEYIEMLERKLRTPVAEAAVAVPTVGTKVRLRSVYGTGIPRSFTGVEFTVTSVSGTELEISGGQMYGTKQPWTWDVDVAATPRALEVV